MGTPAPALLEAQGSVVGDTNAPIAPQTDPETETCSLIKGLGTLISPTVGDIGHKNPTKDTLDTEMITMELRTIASGDLGTIAVHLITNMDPKINSQTDLLSPKIRTSGI